MAEHEHEWEYVEEQIVFEGWNVRIKFEGGDTPEDQTMFVYPAIEPEWQEVEGVRDNKVQCRNCHIEYPYPDGGWEVAWR